MCGLYGFICHQDAPMDEVSILKRSQILRGLGIEMQARGRDSAGVFTVAPVTGKQMIHKKAVTFEQLCTQPAYVNLFRLPQWIAMGHTRAMTTGAITDRNAHPFIKGQIAGTHNGWVINWDDFTDAKYKDHEVDSEIIFDLLNTNGNDYKKTFKELQGAFAIAWYNMKTPNRMYFVRDKNPLYLVKVNSLKTYFWCSTQLALECVLPIVEGAYQYDIWELKENFVYEMNNKFQVTKTPVTFKQPKYSGNFNRNHYDGFDDEPNGKGYQYKAGDFDPNDWKSCSLNDKSVCPTHGAAYRRDNQTKQLSAEATKIAADAFNTNEKKNISTTGGESSAKTIVITPFKERSEFYNNLTVSELTYLYNQLESYGCGGCAELLDISNDGGFWYHRNLKSIYCNKCLEGLQDEDALIFFDEQDYWTVIADMYRLEEKGLVTLTDHEYETA